MKIKKISSGFLFSTWPTCTWQPGHEDKCVCATCICTQPDSPMQCIARIYICKSWNFSFSRTCAHLPNSRQFHSIDKVGFSAIKHRLWSFYEPELWFSSILFSSIFNLLIRIFYFYFCFLITLSLCIISLFYAGKNKEDARTLAASRGETTKPGEYWR